MTVDEFLSDVVSKSVQHLCFYHFTDARNLPSIQKHGLLSVRALAASGIAVAAPGGNKWSRDADALVGVDQFVHLSFTKGNPMRKRAQDDGRIDELVWLRIDPNVLRWPGVMITTDVANQSGVVRGAASSKIKELDHVVIYQRTDWKDPAIKPRLQAADRYEILVPDRIPKSAILNFAHG